MRPLPRKKRFLLPIVLPVLVLLAAPPLPGVSTLPSASARDGVPARGTAFLWKVRSGASVVYLLGSIHFLKREMYPLDRRVEAAFDASDVLAVETDIEGGGKGRLDAFVRGNARYPPGDALERHVSRETYALVRREMADMDPAQVGAMKPWALALAATAAEYVKMGLDPELGIDRHFLRKARGRKPILELEGPDDVVRLLDGLPDAIQDLFLFATLTDLAKSRNQIGRILEYWSKGDARGMESLLRETLNESPTLSPVYEALVDRRNRAMAGKIEAWLKEKRTSFVVVGAAHLVGKEGIVELLTRKGYTVEQE